MLLVYILLPFNWLLFYLTYRQVSGMDERQETGNIQQREGVQHRGSDLVTMFLRRTSSPASKCCCHLS